MRLTWNQLENCELSACRTADALLVVVEEAEDVVVREARASVEEVELDGESQADDFSAQLFDELDGGLHGAAGGEEVVDEDDALAGLDGVEMDFEGVGAVFQIVRDASDGGGKLFRLAYGDEAGIEAVSERGTKDEAAGFNAKDEIDLLLEVVGGKGVNELGEAGLVLEDGGDVVEEDAGLGKIRDGAYEALDVINVQG